MLESALNVFSWKQALDDKKALATKLTIAIRPAYMLPPTDLEYNNPLGNDNASSSS